MKLKFNKLNIVISITSALVINIYFVPTLIQCALIGFGLGFIFPVFEIEPKENKDENK